MKVFKGLAVGILSFLLFLSLAIFCVAFTLNSTMLNPEFVVSEVDKIDVSSLTREIAEEQIGGQLPEEMWFLKEAVYNIISEQEPWLKEQINTAIYSSYDFFLGKSERLSLVISLEALKENLRNSMWDVFTQAIPPQLAGLPPAQVEQYFEQYYQEFAAQIPSSLELDESQIPPEVMQQLLQARQYISYFQTGYYALIGFMALLVLGIILIERNVSNITRGLGITLLTYGAIEFAGIFVARNFLPTDIPLQGIPASLQMWLLGLVSDIFVPLQNLSLGLLIGGVALVIVSFVYKARSAEE